MEENIKTTGSILGILTFIAYINQYFYYWYYDIDISNYIGIDEVFTPFLDDLAWNILVLLFCVGVVQLKNRNKQKLKDEKVKTNKMKDWVFLLLLLIVTFGVPVSMIVQYQNYLLGFMFLLIMILYCIHFCIMTYTEIAENNYPKYPMTIILSFVMSFVLIFNLIFTALAIARNEHTSNGIVYRFILNDTVEIMTDNDNVYLGRTKKVFFIDRKKFNKISVYNTADITYEEIL